MRAFLVVGITLCVIGCGTSSYSQADLRDWCTSQAATKQTTYDGCIKAELDSKERARHDSGSNIDGDRIAAVGAAIATAATVANQGPYPSQSTYSTAPSAGDVTCFKSGEETSGMNKICYYNCLGSTVAINVSSVALCPLTIDH